MATRNPLSGNGLQPDMMRRIQSSSLLASASHIPGWDHRGRGRPRASVRARLLVQLGRRAAERLPSPSQYSRGSCRYRLADTRFLDAGGLIEQLDPLFVKGVLNGFGP